MEKKSKVDGKEDVLLRLRRIEGQVKGIQNMIAEDKHCVDILTQVAAVRSAINKVGSILIEKHAVKCIENAVSSEDKEKTLAELTKAINSLMKYTE